MVHPPDFSVHHKLSDWPECRLDLRCPTSGRSVDLPVCMLLQRGDRLFSEVIRRLRCQCCGRAPAPVYLVAGLMRRTGRGPPACWAVELVGAP